MSKVKVGVLRPIQQPGSYWNRSTALPLVGVEPTHRGNRLCLDAKLANHLAPEDLDVSFRYFKYYQYLQLVGFDKN